MKLQKKTVIDVENVFDYLMGVCGLASQGNREAFEKDAFNYARMVLQAAEQPMQKLGMYVATQHVFDEAERLILVGRFEDADQLLLKTVREMMEKSGTNARLRKLYS